MALIVVGQKRRRLHDAAGSGTDIAGRGAVLPRRSYPACGGLPAALGGGHAERVDLARGLLFRHGGDIPGFPRGADRRGVCAHRPDCRIGGGAAGDGGRGGGAVPLCHGLHPQGYRRALRHCRAGDAALGAPGRRMAAVPRPRFQTARDGGGTPFELRGGGGAPEPSTGGAGGPDSPRGMPQ